MRRNMRTGARKTKDEEVRGRSRVGLVGLGSATGTRRRGYDISRTDDSTRHERPTQQGSDSGTSNQSDPLGCAYIGGMRVRGKSRESRESQGRINEWQDIAVGVEEAERVKKIKPGIAEKES